MRNMCSANERAVTAIDDAAVGVFAFVGKDGHPRSCAVSPYLDAGQAIVSSTLAFTGKVAAVRRDPRMALLAGGAQVRGRAVVEIDLTSAAFDARLRAQELRKYPPARRLLAIPGHRRLLWWYVGRALVKIPLADWEETGGSDKVTLTVLDAGLPRIVPLDPGTGTASDEIAVPAGIADGPACLLVHDEDPKMTDLRQLTLHGTVRDRQFHVERRTGSLTPASSSALEQFRTLRSWARQARARRAVLERWAQDDQAAA